MLKIYNTYIHIPFCERKCNYCDFTSLKGTNSQIEKYVNYAEKVSQLLEINDICGLIDKRNEKTGKKIRDAELSKLPFMLVVGENEEAEGTVSVRKRGEGDLGTMSIEDFIAYFKKEAALSADIK